MKSGTKILIDGVPYRITDCHPGSPGKYMLIIEHDTETGTDLRQSMSALMERLQDSGDRFETSKLIVDWFLAEKLKAGINTSQIVAVMAKPASAQGQIRRLMKNGASIDEIVEVLGFSITDQFWSGILNTSINTIAIPRQDGITLYEKIKSKMIASRHSTLTEVHQTTEEDMIGVEVVE